MNAKKILLVGDDKNAVLLLTDIIKEVNKDADIFCAKDELGAINRLAEISVLPDLIFIDIDTSVTNNFECLKKLKGHIDYKNIPVVILTAFSNQKEQELAYSLGASFFLLKLFDLNLYKKKIINMLNLNFLRVISKKKERFSLNGVSNTNDEVLQILSQLKGEIS